MNLNHISKLVNSLKIFKTYNRYLLPNLSIWIVCSGVNGENARLKLCRVLLMILQHTYVRSSKSSLYYTLEMMM